MATEKVGIYRKYHGLVPIDSSGRPLPKSEWPKKRAHSWCVRWFGADRQRYSKSFESRKEAELFAEEKQSEVRVGEADVPPEIMLKDFIEEHIKLMKGQIAVKTLREHQRALNYLLDIVGNMPLRRITPQHAEMFVNRRSESHVSTTTINKEIQVLARVFKIAANRRGYLPKGSNCFRQLNKRKVSPKTLRYVSPGEFHKLINATCNFKWRTLLSLFYTTGLRVDEIRHLTWKDIDFDSAIVSVAPKRKNDGVIPWEPKDHEMRHIPLCPEMFTLLKEWRTQCPNAVPYVFLSAERYYLVMRQHGSGQWPEAKDLTNNVLRGFNRLRQRAGVAKCTLHDLRRSCITNWARCMPAHVVRKLAGHSSLETTMKYYLVVQNSDLELARKVSSGILNHDPTDPKLTHLTNFEAKFAPSPKGLARNYLENQIVME